MRISIILSCLLSSLCFAEGKTESKYLAVESKLELNKLDAILASSKGERIYKCTEVELSVSKSGGSVSLKAKKN